MLFTLTANPLFINVALAVNPPPPDLAAAEKNACDAAEAAAKTKAVVETIKAQFNNIEKYFSADNGPGSDFLKDANVLALGGEGVDPIISGAYENAMKAINGYESQIQAVGRLKGSVPAFQVTKVITLAGDIGRIMADLFENLKDKGFQPGIQDVGGDPTQDALDKFLDGFPGGRPNPSKPGNGQKGTPPVTPPATGTVDPTAATRDEAEKMFKADYADQQNKDNANFNELNRILGRIPSTPNDQEKRDKQVTASFAIKKAYQDLTNARAGVLDHFGKVDSACIAKDASLASAEFNAAKDELAANKAAIDALQTKYNNLLDNFGIDPTVDRRPKK